MTQQQPPDSPRDLYVRVALLEQAQMHSEERAGLQHEMAATRIRAAEEQIGRVASHAVQVDTRLRSSEQTIRDMSLSLTQQGAAIAAVADKQATTTQAADRARWVIAAIIGLLGVLAGVAPETLGKVTKVLALVP